MRAALLSLLLTAALVSVPGGCTGDGGWRRRQQQQGRFGGRVEGAAAAGPFDLERSGPLRRGTRTHSLVVLPARSASSDWVFLVDLRRRWFLCMDLSGELYSSRLRDEDECLFLRVWWDAAGKRELLYSPAGGRPLTLKAAQRRAARGTAAEAFLGPPAGRRRRSQEVNPSDPLRSQPQPSHSVRDHQGADRAEPDQAGAVSKETITSCDDPLRVLRPSAPGSPVKTNIAEGAGLER